MSTNQLILRNLKKNLKNYLLYVFALVFTVALYFAFVTLQFDPSMDAAEGSIKGAGAIKAASVLLIGIVTVFLLYANTIFIKRRSKEIGLFQLIGMTKGKIFRILTMENFLLYFSSILLGVLAGFSFSKLILLILFKVTSVDSVAQLRFSPEALSQTLLVFGCIFLLIMAMNYLFIKKQTILSLFRVLSSSEEMVKRISVWEILIGIAGLCLISSGYYMSSKMFDGDLTSATMLFLTMIYILGSVIIGTYLFYKGSVRFIFHLIRKKKDGYLSINEVLSLSSIMFRMKSNAFLLTVITTVSALAIGLLSLSYISYYSAEKSAEQNVPNDFSIYHSEDADTFRKSLDEVDILYSAKEIEVYQAKVNMEEVINSNAEGLYVDIASIQTAVIGENSVEGLELSEGEAILTGFSSMLASIISFEDSGRIELIGMTERIPLDYLELRDDYLLSLPFTSSGFPIVVVDNTVMERLSVDLDQEIQRSSYLYTGIDISDKQDLNQAISIFEDLDLGSTGPNDSQLLTSNSMKNNMGFVMFIVGFLGLTFLVTSGCILYFKQVDESEEEKPNYTILRKLGFTQWDLLRGIQAKQLFNFGIPLVVGLLHSYFAVQSGWFFFGTEVWTPMIIVMIIYTGLYSIFGFLSVLSYKKVIKDAL
ncbi:ABC transporter permease [Sutcliffiella horikoshii]|uniref:ABC transporter permease n=1 Tax=Sutcliffiella horikoshii TaxID=79883 RepID=UPI001F1B89E9|nr:ABC transporter permease [Sutcliffiella horikoshii]MCG1021187.1 ABC transporter permease [Sutcliffiella horikoshii]